MSDEPTLTTESGASVADNQNSQIAADAEYGRRVAEGIAARRGAVVGVGR
jgi:hypothetical protein